MSKRFIKVRVEDLDFNEVLQRNVQAVAAEVDELYQAQRYNSLHFYFNTIKEKVKKDREDLVWMLDYAKKNNMATPSYDFVCIKKPAS